jgi:hypothetical protein
MVSAMLNPSIADFPYKSDDSFEEGVLLDLDYWAVLAC